MCAERRLFTSEAVTMGHPDKIADQISDAILDSIMAQDPHGRVAVETLVTTGLAMVAGEITTTCYVEIPVVVRETIREIGYTDASMGFDFETCAVLTSIQKQSEDISIGVSEGQGLHREQGAGDQGMMFGFACRETPELMPLPIMLARRLVDELSRLRQKGEIHYLRPDGKTQVTVEYEGHRPVRVDTVVISTQHTPEVDYEKIKSDMVEKVIRRVIPVEMLDEETIFHVNPTGRFVTGGPHGDTGVTGRKIIFDTYGGRGRHGGGAFSGKDPSKVDRSAAYMARYIAKNVVAAGLSDICEIQLSYAIGVADPVSVMVETFGTGKAPEEKIEKLVRKHFPLKPKGLIEILNLRRPIFKETARHGHFGRNHPDYTWEKTDRADALRRDAGL
jgi:S-adenosylmethionine synthetase